MEECTQTQDIQPLNPPQIKNFLKNWHLHTDPSIEHSTRDKRTERIQHTVENVPAITQLAKNPLLLTMTAILNRGAELPTQRLRRWRSQDTVDFVKSKTGVTIADFKYLKKLAILRDLACAMQKPYSTLGDLIHQDALKGRFKKHVDAMELKTVDSDAGAEALIRQLREHHYILSYLGGKSYAFSIVHSSSISVLSMLKHKVSHTREL